MILGYVGDEPTMHYTEGGIPVTNFSVAVNKRYKDEDGNNVDKTTWFRVTCWRKLAEPAAAHLTKGRLVLVIGEVEEPFAYLDQQDGTPRATLNVTASWIQYLGRRTEQTPELSADAEEGT